MASRLAAPTRTTIEQDSYVWALEQAALLRARQFGELDLEALGEEVEDLARRQDHDVRSRVRTIIEHLLKLACSLAAEPRAGWRRTVRTQRRDLLEILTPALGTKLGVDFPELYRQAREDAADELLDRREIPTSDDVPEIAPFTLDQAIDPAWWPEAGLCGLGERGPSYQGRLEKQQWFGDD